jgi:electron transfer flavoprotein beta subunit
MNSLVCVSHVPDTTTKIVFSPDGKSLNEAGVTFIIGPYEEYGLTRALELKEGNNNQGQVTALCVGAAATEPTLRKALAIGADDAVRIDANPTDAYFVAKQIAEFAKGKEYQVIFTGKEAIDNNGAEVPGMLAELMGIPYVASAIKFDIVGDKAHIQREIDGGYEVLESTLPVIVACQKGVAEWRIPNMRGIMAARTKPLTVVAPVAADSYTTVEKFENPPAKAGVKYFQPDQVDEIVKVLVEKGAL